MDTGEPTFLAGRFRNCAVGLLVGLSVSTALGIVGVRDPALASTGADSPARLPFRLALDSFLAVALRLRPVEVVVVVVVTKEAPPAAAPLFARVGVEATDAFLARLVGLAAVVFVVGAVVTGGRTGVIAALEGTESDPEVFTNPPCGPPGPWALLRCVVRPPTCA